jgi:hypothetical protein
MSLIALLEGRAGSTGRCLALAALVISLASCGGGENGSGKPPPPLTYSATSGVAQKGPLIKGSTVTAQELDAKLSPTGKQYTYQTTSDLGTFSPTSAFGSQYIGLIATGYYFDEVADALSTGTITLNGYSDLTAAPVLNVNLLTTLAYQRIQHLVAQSNMSFGDATSQAEREVLAALNIPPGTYEGFGTLDLAGGTDSDHLLATISSIFIYGNSAAALSQLIANFQSDIAAHGVITEPATKAALVGASKSVDPVAVAANLSQAYSSVGVSFAPTDISDWIDRDGDGVIGKFKFQVPDASPSSSFTLPAFVANQLSGTSVSVMGGALAVNGTPANGSVEIHSGDAIAISPSPGTFPNGVLDVYLVTGTTRLARVSFVATLLSIAITPAGPVIASGIKQQFAATGTFSDGSTSDLSTLVSWTSETPAVASVNASGLASSFSAGSTLVTATSGSVSGSTTLTVTSAALQSLAITPNPARAGVGFARQLTVTGTYSDATTANLTNVATWSSDTPSVATVGPTTGVVTGVSLGSATITAAYGPISTTAPLNILSGVWYPGGEMVAPRVGHTVTLLPNGKLLAAGGLSNGQFSASSELYDPATGKWTATGSLGTARSGHAAALLPNGKVLVAGGGSVSPLYTASSELYDPATGSWASTGSLAAAGAIFTATLLQNGKVLLTGGTDGTNAFAASQLYDPATGKWTATGSLATARAYHTATLLQNGRVLVTGGTTTFLEPIASSELYDPVAGTWSTTGTLSTARDSHTATLLQNGKVLVTGGGNNNAIVMVASSELYDPVAGTWSSTGDLATARLYHSAVLLNDGKVVVAGGMAPNNTQYFPGCELYDPGAGTFSPTGNLELARYMHTATLLPNGAVLVVGGYVDPQGDQAESELYW